MADESDKSGGVMLESPIEKAPGTIQRLRQRFIRVFGRPQANGRNVAGPALRALLTLYYELFKAGKLASLTPEEDHEERGQLQTLIAEGRTKLAERAKDRLGAASR